MESRDLKVIEQEYAQLCGQIGDCVVKLADMERVKAELVGKVNALQQEWVLAKAASNG